MPRSVLDALVIGAGSAGLATAYHLQRRGLAFRVLEAGRSASGSWPAYYHSLRLFTPAQHSALPGLPFPGDPQRYPSRAEQADYLRGYAAHFAFPVEYRAEVLHLERRQGVYSAVAEDGRRWTARAVICASGTFGRPYTPHLPGQEIFGGTLLHSSEYRAPEPFAGERVIVVGAGNSGAQIAAELGRVARVTLIARHPPHFFPQRPLGRDITDWLDWSGIERVPLGLLGRLPDTQPVIAVPGLRAAFESGNPDIQLMFRSFTPGGVRWGNGSTERVDSVIFATGYGWNGSYLPACALDDVGEPLQRLGVSTALPGLYFVGLPGQRTVASGTLRAAGPDAAAVTRHLAHALKQHRLEDNRVHA